MDFLAVTTAALSAFARRGRKGLHRELTKQVRFGAGAIRVLSEVIGAWCDRCLPKDELRWRQAASEDGSIESLVSGRIKKGRVGKRKGYRHLLADAAMDVRYAVATGNTQSVDPDAPRNCVAFFDGSIDLAHEGNSFALLCRRCKLCFSVLANTRYQRILLGLQKKFVDLVHSDPKVTLVLVAQPDSVPSAVSWQFGEVFEPNDTREGLEKFIQTLESGE